MSFIEMEQTISCQQMEIEDLRTELTAFKTELREICLTIDDPACDLTLTTVECIKKLKAENASLKRDAERYRMLRRGQRWSVVNGIGDYIRADELDAAIDAAMIAGDKNVLD